jgi:hypothetical protein
MGVKRGTRPRGRASWAHGRHLVAPRDRWLADDISNASSIA